MIDCNDEFRFRWHYRVVACVESSDRVGDLYSPQRDGDDIDW